MSAIPTRVPRVVAVLAALALCAGCTVPTQITGTLVLLPGQNGDVRSSRVQLHESSDLSDNPVRSVRAGNSDRPDRAPFVFTDLLDGYYFVLAWKDLDGDSLLSDGDLVGVHGGLYEPGHGGTQVAVHKGATSDAGDIQMKVWRVEEPQRDAAPDLSAALRID